MTTEPVLTNVPATTEGVQTEVPVDVLVTTDGVPVTTEGVPVTTEGVPATTEGVLTKVPATAEGVPTKIPDTTEGVPFTTVGVPTEIATRYNRRGTNYNCGGTKRGTCMVCYKVGYMHKNLDKKNIIFSIATYPNISRKYMCCS